MRIMVFDLPAESGGALTILKQYYDKAVKDKENNWMFVISTPNLSETENIKILKYPWVKKSWFHRLYFEKYIANKIVTTNNIDEILSLQNIIVNNTKVKQTLYLHQPLPFVEKRYGIIENFKFWIYQNLISKIIYKSIKKADKVIVQTIWMKEACLKIDNDPKKFEIKQPEISIKIRKKYERKDNQNKIFFYPASGLIYKNHKIIVEAAIELKKENIKNYKIIFTLRGNEDKNIKKLYKKVIKYNLPIDFIGQITVEEVYNYYNKSILIFPSYIETFGLPLLEAKMHETPIIASDCSFSHEILDGSKNVYFFNAFNKYELAQIIKKVILR